MSGDTMLSAAREGYRGSLNPHMYSSPLWYAHALGEWLRREDYEIPNECSMSRGYSVRADGVVFRSVEVNGKHARFERVYS